MKQEAIAAQLQTIAAQLTALDRKLAARSAPAEAVATALADIEQSYGLIGQLAEVAHAQREQIEALITRIDRLLALFDQHDKRLDGYGSAAENERRELRELMVQLRELARTQVRTTADLVRQVGDGNGWDGEERRRRAG